MKLKIKERCELTLPLTLRCGMTVNVRRPSQVQRRELTETCSREEINRVNGRMEKIVDDALWNQKAPDFYVAGWFGFKPEMLPQLNIEVEELPATNGDGCIPYDKELARQLWENATGFQLDIVRFADQMLTALALEKKTDLLTSESSS